MMNSVYLIGGGWRAETFAQTYGRFLHSATKNGQRRIAIIVAEEDGANPHEHFLRFFSAFETLGLKHSEAFEVLVSAENVLTAENFSEIRPTGIFVCGGLTPAYYDAICRDKFWLKYSIENEIPYCGFSAGASIAAKDAIIGGWRREINDRILEIADENASEDLDLLSVRNGLELVPFAVEVHATQWGTLSRLVHTIAADLALEGWAIDENTMLEIKDNAVSIYGAGNAYHVCRRNEQITVEVLQTNHLEEIE